MAPPIGISIAPADDVFTADPGWVRIDQTYKVQSWTIDRGRQNEMSKIDAGTARIELVDMYGDFDPTNTTSVFYPNTIGPPQQAAICLQNPTTEAWTTLFRGFISRLEWVPYRTSMGTPPANPPLPAPPATAPPQWANVTLELTDGLGLLAAMEMPADGTFGDQVYESNIIFNKDIGNGAPPLEAVKRRIEKVLTQADWPLTLRTIFTGNVTLQEASYAPRTSVLQVLQDSAEADFPDAAATIYIGGPRLPGHVVFHGRYTRFNPGDVSYNIRTWQLGDDAAHAADATVIRVSPPLVASLDDTLIYTSAMAANANIHDGDLPGQYNTDAAAVALRGLRSWSAEGLLTFNGSGTSGEAETRKFAKFIVDNYKTPKLRVGTLTIKPRRPGATTTWDMLGKIDISDIVHLKTTHAGGGGFNHDFFVEGIHYSARPGPKYPGYAPPTWLIDLTLDVSPRAAYAANPFV